MQSFGSRRRRLCCGLIAGSELALQPSYVRTELSTQRDAGTLLFLLLLLLLLLLLSPFLLCDIVRGQTERRWHLSSANFVEAPRVGLFVSWC